MKVVAYFHDPNSLLFQGDVIGLWAMSFLRQGFEPKLCAEIDALRHPRYGEFKEMCKRVPSPNPRYYIESNFMRWLVAQLEAPCLFTDWDVLNLRLRPRNFWADSDFKILDRGLVPCAIAGTAIGFGKYVDQLTRWAECLENNISGDMQVLRHFYHDSTGECDSADAGNAGKLSLVHFPNAMSQTMRGEGNRRADYMRKFYQRNF